MLLPCLAFAVFATMQVELNWLLDDAVAALRFAEDSEWQAATWRQLQSYGKMQHTSHHDSARQQGTVALRADTTTLSKWWKQRVEDRCVHWTSKAYILGLHGSLSSCHSV